MRIRGRNGNTENRDERGWLLLPTLVGRITLAAPPSPPSLCGFDAEGKEGGVDGRQGGGCSVQSQIYFKCSVSLKDDLGSCPYYCFVDVHLLGSFLK